MVKHRGFFEGMLYGVVESSDTFKVLDWKAVKNYINANIKTIKSVEVGLEEDWTYTSGEIYNNEDGYVDNYTYTSSRWATPIALVRYNDGSTKEIEFWNIDGDE